MITVGNNVHTAACVREAFAKRRLLIDELCPPAYLLHIDSKVLEQALTGRHVAHAQANGRPARRGSVGAGERARRVAAIRTSRMRFGDRRRRDRGGSRGARGVRRCAR
jgi:hypothetical protein